MGMWPHRDTLPARLTQRVRQPGNGPVHRRRQWRTTILCGRTRPAGARIRQFVWGLLRSVAPLTKHGALALGNRAVKTGAQIAGDVLSGENIRTAAKRRTKTAGRDLLHSLLATPSPPGKRVKRAAPQRGRSSSSRKRRPRAEPVKRAARKRRLADADVFS